MTKRSAKRNRRKGKQTSQQPAAATSKSPSTQPLITPPPSNASPGNRANHAKVDISSQKLETRDLNKSPDQQAAAINSEPTPAELQVPHYDPHIMPAETVARQRREGAHFGHVEHDSKETSHIHNRDGYTIDQEGLINNYAIEPKMYINEPGDLVKFT